MKKQQSRNHEKGTMNKVVDKSQSSEIKGEQNRPMHNLKRWQLVSVPHMEI